jgi:hypothetical protein
MIDLPILLERTVKKKALLTAAVLSVALTSCDIEMMERAVVTLWVNWFVALAGGIGDDPEGGRERPEFKEAQRQTEMWKAIEWYDIDKVKRYLEEGYDPDRSNGDQGYKTRNPLDIVTNGFYTTYARRWEEMPDPTPDVAIVRLLVEAGADVNRRPYIWRRVSTYGNWILDQEVEREINSRSNEWNYYDAPAEAKEKELYNYDGVEEIVTLYFVNDSNRVLEALLKAGADPDKRGHPYPYNDAPNNISEEETNKYFAKGTRPINEAIKKGMRWESQVDLLLQYTTVDKDSLKAAKASKDRAMRKKIEKLWKEQNVGKKKE